MNTKELVTTVDIAAASISVAVSAKEVRPSRRPALDLRSLIEKDVQAEVSKAKASPDQLERHIRSAFVNGMVLGARLQTKLPDVTTDEDAWCGLVEEK
jgi:hypothetical protein